MYVLDACAMIAYLRDEAGADVVEAAMLDPTYQCFAHCINLCEVFYTFHRDGGDGAAVGAINDLFTMAVVERDDADQSFWQDVGRLKSSGRISIADCFALTLASRVGGSLLTSDHHELDRIASLGVYNITFIR